MHDHVRVMAVVAVEAVALPPAAAAASPAVATRCVAAATGGSNLAAHILPVAGGEVQAALSEEPAAALMSP